MSAVFDIPCAEKYGYVLGAIRLCFVSGFYSMPQWGCVILLWMLGEDSPKNVRAVASKLHS